MKIAENERRHVIARGSSSFYVFRCVAFGLACGPLLWGRLAAFASRFTQAIFQPGELRVQTYVDDPAGIVYGHSGDHRDKLLTIFLLFSRVLGFDVNWRKVQRGAEIDWIGARFGLDEENGVTVSLSAEKAATLRTALDSMLRTTMVQEKRARSIAGLASWAASVVPRARPFVAHMFGAIADAKSSGPPARTTTRRRPKDLIFIRRFEHSARWLQALLRDETALVRKFSVNLRHTPTSLGLRTDASPFGMGAVLFDFVTGAILAYWADSISDLDIGRFKAVRGAPDWQNEYELLAVVVSLEVFQTQLAGRTFALQADNTAAIQAALNLKSGKALLNTMAGEIALRLDRLRAHLGVTEHIPGLLNFVADALSRLEQGKELPKVLYDAMRVTAPRRDANFWLCWPQEW